MYIYWLIERLIIAYVGKKYIFKNWLKRTEESKEKQKTYFSYSQILQIELLKNYIYLVIWLK